MKILDYFEHPRFGVIVSSTDSKFDNFSDDEIKKRIGDTIVLVSNSHQRKLAKVKNVDIATSLTGKKNINICLSDSIKLSDIKPISQLLLLSEINIA